MNRQRSRRATAEVDQGFSDFQSMYRHIFADTPDREIGLAWMRGENIRHKNRTIVLCRSGDTPPQDHKRLDIKVSAQYRAQFFQAYLKKADLDHVAAEWPRMIGHLLKEYGGGPSPLTGNLRSDARGFILEMLVGNHHFEDEFIAAYVGCAIAFLVRTSASVGDLFGRFHKHAHYHITDDPGGGLVFSIQLNQQHLHPRTEDEHD